MEKVPVILSSDLEPADRQTAVGDTGDWAGLEEVIAEITAIRPRLAKATNAPAHFNWFLRCDPQIEISYRSSTWLADHHGSKLANLADAGDELGIHAHAYRWDGEAEAWIVDHGNQAWVNHCIASSVRAYRRALGRPPRAFRFGDHFMNNATMSFVEHSGFRYDLTTEPGSLPAPAMVKTDRTTGELPDYRNMPRAMYRPSRLDYQRPGLWLRRNIWMIPVSTGCSHGPVIPDPADPSPMLYPLHLMMDPGIFRRVMDGLLALMAKPYLMMVSRSGDCASPERLANLHANLEFIATHPAVGKFVFTTPAEAVKCYARAGTAR